VTPQPDGSRKEIRAWLRENADAQDPTVITRLDFQDELTLRGPMSFTHLFLLDPDDAEATPQRVTDGFFNHHGAAFMPDGRSIVYAAQKDTARHPDRVQERGLWKIGTDGSGDRLLLAREGWRFGDPRPSADGSVIAFGGYRLDEPAYRPWQLGLIAADASPDDEPLWLTGPETDDVDLYGFEWDRTRSSLLFVTPRRGGFPLLTMSRGLLEPAAVVETLDGQSAGVHAFGTGGGTVLAAVTTPANPCVLVVRDGHGERVAWDLNTWVHQRELSMPTEGSVSRPDGTSVQFWLMEPTQREPRKKYPIVLEMHGGPSAMWGPGELTMWHEFQLLCAWGYAVAYANPRGSGGYGYEFQRANFQDWGEGPAGDVLAALEHVVQGNDWIDPQRQVITGGSYAGYLTAWIVAHDQRFKAAVAQRGVYDLQTFFGEGNAWRLVEYTMGGRPFDPRYRQIIERNSPFTYVQRIRTPLLIIHASQDLRAGVVQSEMLYRALKAQERPVEYVRYPNAGHDLSRTGDPRHRMDRLNRIVEFFERHIGNPRPAPVHRPVE
jgi:dipeptidyl aminopeptidase/acylaminoacyl peptidase